jgi:hypothetical protein
VPFDYQPSQWTDDDKPEGSSSVSRIPGCILWYGWKRWDSG